MTLMSRAYILKAELNSKSVPKIKKSASKIAKQQISGFEDDLIIALEFLMQKTKSWSAQAEVIKAIGITGTKKSIPYLMNLSIKEYDSTVIYSSLAFSIFLLTDLKKGNLNYLNSILNTSNYMLLSGACAALLFSKIIPRNEDIINILISVSHYSENEGSVITPRCYIAAACYTWPSELTREFLAVCKKSHWDGLVEIATDSFIGKKTKYVLV